MDVAEVSQDVGLPSERMSLTMASAYALVLATPQLTFTHN
jgi:hypothetical protein